MRTLTIHNQRAGMWCHYNATYNSVMSVTSANRACWTYHLRYPHMAVGRRIREDVPEFLQRMITPASFEVLTTAIELDWIDTAKYFASWNEQRGDVGTPYAVDLVLREPDEHFEHMDCVPRGDLDNLRELMIVGFLLGTNFVGVGYIVADSDGKDQLEGEMKRQAQWPATKESLKAYCDSAKISSPKLRTWMAERLEV